MNRGHLLHQSSPVQQMMAANPNWWNINTNTTRPDQQQQQLPSPFFSPPPNTFLPPYSSYSLPLPSWLHDHTQDLPPDSWTQLLMGGSVGEEAKKLSWEDEQVVVLSAQAAPNAPLVDNIKQESSVNSYGYGNGDEFQAAKPPASASASASASAWPPRILLPRPSASASASASSPKSCVTSFSTNLLDFSNTTTTDHLASRQQPLPDPSPPECNSGVAGGAAKKARVQASTTQSSFKVRKEKLGDRITSLHQLVSPFGKTDTASVLLEAIGYIRFLQSQIEALSLPYLGTGSPNMRQHQVQHSVQGESNCIFPEDPGQLLNEKCLKRKAAGNKLQDSREEGKKDLRSRGLCLVPVSCTMQVGSENGADYWAPALGGGFR